MSASSPGLRGGISRVGRTGISLVHEGELIYPAPGSEAELSPADSGPAEFIFPVEVEVREVSGASEELVAAVLDRLTQALG